MKDTQSKVSNVKIYVEGPSDKLAMEVLFSTLMGRLSENGIRVTFLHCKKGDAKKYLLIGIPRKAARILAKNSGACVICMPDLYPKNKGFPHESFEELQAGLVTRFMSELGNLGIADDDRLKNRFKVFCFKHDLEALILACDHGIKYRLQTDHLKIGWATPVEDQDFGDPPKRVVERLFKEHGRRYDARVDAPVILSFCSYQELAEKCPERFGPFATFLESLGGPEDAYV